MLYRCKRLFYLYLILVNFITLNPLRANIADDFKKAGKKIGKAFSEAENKIDKKLKPKSYDVTINNNTEDEVKLRAAWHKGFNVLETKERIIKPKEKVTIPGVAAYAIRSVRVSSNKPNSPTHSAEKVYHWPGHYGNLSFTVNKVNAYKLD